MKKFMSLIVFIVPLVTAAADNGGGGIISGTHLNYGQFANYELKATYFGGFGYGASDRGTRVGGFGVTILDNSDEHLLIGGFGGTIVGQEFTAHPVTVAATSWTGLGGIAADLQGGRGGYFAFMEEISFEAGIAVVPWMQIVMYAGFQIIGSILPGFMFNEAFSYTPTFGLRIAFGSF